MFVAAGEIHENLEKSMNFHGSGDGVGAGVTPESLQIYNFLCMFVVWAEGWAAPESLKIFGFLFIFMVGAVGLKRVENI